MVKRLFPVILFVGLTCCGLADSWLIKAWNQPQTMVNRLVGQKRASRPDGEELTYVNAKGFDEVMVTFKEGRAADISVNLGAHVKDWKVGLSRVGISSAGVRVVGKGKTKGNIPYVAVGPVAGLASEVKVRFSAPTRVKYGTRNVDFPAFLTLTREH